MEAKMIILVDQNGNEYYPDRNGVFIVDFQGKDVVCLTVRRIK